MRWLVLLAILPMIGSAARAAADARTVACGQRARSRGLDGDERSGFVADCLAGRIDPNGPGKEQACAAKADRQGVDGDRRIRFLRRCRA
jgi:hypothetical protein